MAKKKKGSKKSKAGKKAKPAKARAKSAKKGAPKKAKGKKAKPKKAKAKAKAKAKPKAKAAKAKVAKPKAKAKVAKPKAKAKVAKSKAAKPKAAKAKPEKTEAAAPASSPSLSEGARAPSFELPDQDGNVVSSSSLNGAPYVLYFYPKDDTTGCTKEACDFRDFGGKFGALSVRIVGVSPDSSASHAQFRSKYGLPFTLLSDAEKTLANAYGVWVKKQNYGREYMGIQRSTFLVDADGVIKKAWHGVRVPGHVENVLSAL